MTHLLSRIQVSPHLWVRYRRLRAHQYHCLRCRHIGRSPPQRWQAHLLVLLDAEGMTATNLCKGKRGGGGGLDARSIGAN